MKQYDGRITTQNLVPTGVATAGSVVELLNLTDDGSVAIQVTGTYTGALTAYGRVNGKDWVLLSGFTNVATGATVANIASGTAGLFRADVSGFEAFRLSADGAVTGTAVVAVRAGAAAASNTDVSVSLENSDVQIGVVEIKDATTDNRQVVAADGRAATDANLQIGNVDSPGGAGAVTASTPRVHLTDESLAALELVGIKGKDGATAASDTNAVAVAPIVGQAGVAAGAGAVNALTQRVTLASDDPAVAALQTANATVLASAARTITTNSADQTNAGRNGLHVVIDATAITATPSVVFTLQGKDAVSGKYYTLLASAAITAVGTTVLRLHPGLTAAANTVANDLLPRTWRISAAHGNADSITYSVGASLS